jgi:hypothetical protein
LRIEKLSEEIRDMMPRPEHPANRALNTIGAAASAAGAFGVVQQIIKFFGSL